MNEESLYTKAYCFYEKGHYEEAAEHFQQLVAMNAFQSEYWFGLGSALQLKKDYEKALRAWSVAAVLDFHNPYPHFHAAECLLSLGDTKEAMLALQEAEKRAVEMPLKQKILVLKEIWNGQDSRSTFE